MSLEHLIRFETDIVGLERTLRLVQSMLMLTLSYPWLLELIVYVGGVLNGAPASASAAADPEKHLAVLAHYSHVTVGLRNLVNVVRRFFRVFRFVESFHRANQQFAALIRDQGSQATKRPFSVTLPPLLDAFSAAFFGMHLVLEVLVLPDVVHVDGLEAWGPAWTARLTFESLRFWFFALACSLGAGLLRLMRVAADVPIPPIKEEMEKSPLSEKDGPRPDEEDEETKRKVLNEERLRLRRIVDARMEQRRVWRRGVRARAAVLGRRVLADGIDLIIPGTAVGWMSAKPGTVGLAMFTTTLLTGYEAWRRCGEGL